MVASPLRRRWEARAERSSERLASDHTPQCRSRAWSGWRCRFSPGASMSARHTGIGAVNDTRLAAFRIVTLVSPLLRPYSLVDVGIVCEGRGHQDTPGFSPAHLWTALGRPWPGHAAYDAPTPHCEISSWGLSRAPSWRTDVGHKPQRQSHLPAHGCALQAVWRGSMHHAIPSANTTSPCLVV